MSVFAKLVESAAFTATGASDPVENLAPRTMGTVYVNVSAVSGTTPTLDLYLQGSYDGGQNWVDLASSPQVTATGGVILALSSQGAASAPFAATDGTMAASTAKTVTFPDRVRLKYKIAGTTPSFTFSARGVFK